jgi:hypothetical protein
VKEAPIPIGFTFDERLLRETVLREREYDIRLSYENAIAFDTEWERDKRKMALWIDSVITRRVTPIT